MGREIENRRKNDKRVFSKAILIPFLFSGCVFDKNNHIGYIKYRGETCYSTGQDIKLLYDNGIISCENGNKEIAIEKKFKILDHNIENDKCETEITEKFYSKASGWITICKGKLLRDGQVSRVVEVRK